MISYEELKQALPKQKRKLLTEPVYQELVKLEDPNYDLREDILTYIKVLEEGKYRLLDYFKAVKYVALKSMGHTNYDAYKIIFPDKCNRWLNEGVRLEDQHKYVNKWNKGKLVTEITKKAIIPTWITHQDYVHEAILVNVDLMRNARSEMVKQKAAIDLMTYLKQPEDNKMTLDVNINKSDSLVQLEDTLNRFAEEQLKAIESKNVSAKEIAEMDIIEVEPDD